MKKTVFALFVLMLVALVCLYPGLSGGFLLDDYGTLPPLGAWGGLTSWVELREYVFGGFTGPTGRPVSLLSFALNGGAWPDHPSWFLSVNVAIHLLNGILAYWVIAKLLIAARVQSAQLIAFVTTAFWVLHPAQVSTVLYIVQRMTQLECLFNLLCIASFISLRNTLASNALTRAGAWFCVFGAAGVLALLSKENAVLIPLQLLLIDRYLVWAGAPCSTASYRWFRICCVLLPSVIVIGYLANRWYLYIATGQSHSGRGFTVWQRQLTEFRVVGDYLLLYLVPKIQTAGVFQDGYPKSTGWLSPASTLIWFFVHSAIVGGAVWARKKLPVIAFGVLWFYVGHLLESTVIQLELKFEHRNYLPSLGFALCMAYGLSRLPLPRKSQLGVMLAVGLYYSVCLFMRASLWGNQLMAVDVWARENPNSHRALEFAAMVHLRHPDGRPAAVAYLQRALALSNEDPAVELKLITYTCDYLAVTPQQVSSLEQRLPSAPMNWQIGDLMAVIGGAVIERRCIGVAAEEFRRLINASLKNPHFSATRVTYKLWFEWIKVDLAVGDPERAARNAMNVFGKPNVPLGIVMRVAIMLASSGNPEAGYKIIDIALTSGGASLGSSAFLISQAKEIRENIKRDL
ncbi:hypothetical protein [Teredinibacter waterburyi]|uniref:hypothetical protein n=1 Tax=Teredinibacter waterburyi TaxID=1500538 RepID=UPI00165EE8A8|nr:hypothetical protein [Teredinibacter waterburyi]